MPFDHIVVIVEQDHTYDSYFRSYSSPDRAASPIVRVSRRQACSAWPTTTCCSTTTSHRRAGGTLGNMLDLMTGDTHGLLFSSKESLTALATLDVPTVFDRLNARGRRLAPLRRRLHSASTRPRSPTARTPPTTPRVPASLYRAPVLAMQAARGTDPALIVADHGSGAVLRTTPETDSLPPFSLVLPSPSDSPAQGGNDGRAPASQPRQRHREEQPVGPHGHLRHMGRRRRTVRQRGASRRRWPSGAADAASRPTPSRATSRTSSTTISPSSTSSRPDSGSRPSAPIPTPHRRSTTRSTSAPVRVPHSSASGQDFPRHRSARRARTSAPSSCTRSGSLPQRPSRG